MADFYLFFSPPLFSKTKLELPTHIFLTSLRGRRNTRDIFSPICYLTQPDIHYYYWYFSFNRKLYRRVYATYSVRYINTALRFLENVKVICDFALSLFYFVWWGKISLLYVVCWALSHFCRYGRPSSHSQCYGDRERERRVPTSLFSIYLKRIWQWHTHTVKSHKSDYVPLCTYEKSPSLSIPPVVYTVAMDVPTCTYLNLRT